MGWQYNEPKEIRLMDGNGPCRKSFEAIYGQDDSNGNWFYISPSGYKVTLRWYELITEDDTELDVRVKVMQYNKVSALRNELERIKRELRDNE